MKITRRTTLKMVGGAAAAGALSASMPGVATAQEKQLNVALPELPNQLDPLRYLTNPGYRVMYNIYDTLIDVDHKNNGQLRPGLATEWTRVDDQTMELKLREGVVFHDGSPLTAKDVVFTFSDERIRSPDSPGFANAQQHLSTITGAAAVDDMTVRVTTSGPDPVLEIRLAAWGAQIISESAFRAAGGWDQFAQKPVGTGPFSVAAFSPEEVRLAAFDQYWNGAPNIKVVSYRSSPELSARIAGLVSGDFDLIADVPPDQFAAVTRDPNLEIVGGSIASIRAIKFDTRNEQLKDPRVRQALILAIDRQAIVDALWAGLVDIPNGHQLPSFGELYDPNRPKPAYDPEKAKQLLAEAGYDGTPIPFRTRTGAYGPELATAQILVSMWNAVGINIDLQIKENFGQLLEYPGTGMRSGVDPVLVNDPLFSVWRSYNEAEIDVWPKPEFYVLGHELETTLDPARRKELLSQMLDIMDADPPTIILHQMGLFYGKRKDVQWTPYPHVYMDFRRDNADIVG